jgi:hypothetical protein
VWRAAGSAGSAPGRRDRRIGFLVHALLEAFDTLAEITHHFGNAATAEQNQHDQRQDDQVR